MMQLVFVLGLIFGVLLGFFIVCLFHGSRLVQEEIKCLMDRKEIRKDAVMEFVRRFDKNFCRMSRVADISPMTCVRLTFIELYDDSIYSERFVGERTEED